MRLRRAWSVSVVVGLLAASAALGAADDAVAAGSPQPYSVTFVARVCPTYPDIMANRARNNIQESLRDLGKDTVYSAGQPISPAIEEPNQPNCHPLSDWQFALGTGYTGKSPSTAYLSTVSNPYAQTIAVLPSTPELDSAGNDTGRSVETAVTVPLTDEQVRRAQQSNSLWTQGGLKTDPLLTDAFGAAYGFGALRCAIDNLNGDNVEWIGFPSGARHVFCYYYAVQPPPKAGTIVVRKSLAAGTNGPASFRYVGNISYTTTNDFTLTPQSDTQPASATFIRAAGDAWDFEEQPQSGFTPVSLTCAQTTPPVTGPTSTWTISGRRAVVRVGDGATVRCDYVNKDVPPPTGDLRLNKVTYGSVGSFPFKVTDPDGQTFKAIARTTAQGQEDVVLQTSQGRTGVWTVRETLPAATPEGHWDITSVQCNGADVPFTASDGPSGTTFVRASREVAAKETVDCTFANTFTHGGELVLQKRTSGGSGTFAFPVVRGGPTTGTDLFTAYSATTTSADTVVTATPIAGRTSLTHLPVGQGDASTYRIGELLPPTSGTASWQLTAVTCTDLDTDLPVSDPVVRTVPYVTVTLTAEHPRIRCLFDNQLVDPGTGPTDSVVTLLKTIKGRQAGQQGVVRLTLRCADGSVGALQVAAGSTGTVGADAPFVISGTTSCTVTEPDTGARAGAELTSTTWQIDSGDPTSGDHVTFTTAPGQQTTVTVTDVFGGLAPSGASPATAGYALAGLVLLCLGVVVYAAAVVRD
jgi:hypothetical protein